MASLREEGIDAMYSVCDVRQADAVAAAVQSVLASYGRLDLLVNNAAGNFPALIADLSPNGFKAVVDIDLVGTFNVSKAVYEGWMRVNRLGFDAGFIVEASPAGTPGFERSRWSRSRRAGVPIYMPTMITPTRPFSAATRAEQASPNVRQKPISKSLLSARKPTEYGDGHDVGAVRIGVSSGSRRTR